MDALENAYVEFNIDDELKKKFCDFRTLWGARKSDVASYRIMTTISNVDTDSKLNLQGGDNA